jgi:hypothetical protein
MKRNIKFIVLSLLLSFSINNLFAFDNGEVRFENKKQFAWNKKAKQWISLEEFWRDYAKKNGGLTWGQSKTYPPYDDVTENDLFMVEIESVLCLMEFFHTRWRRANDVRRWDDKFNEYSGCKKVFD